MKHEAHPHGSDRPISSVAVDRHHLARTAPPQANQATDEGLSVHGVPKPEGRLTHTQELFVHEYLKDRNGTQAYLRVYPKAKARSARTEAWRLLTNPDVRRALEVERVKHIRSLSMDRERLIGELVAIATADPNDLIEYRRLPCPECHANANDASGLHAPPNPDCKSCSGEGVGKVIIKDTRFLSPEARALYAGVKVTRDGVQVLMRDQDGAIDRLARLLGVFEADNTQGPAAFAQAMSEFMAHIGESGSRLPIVNSPPRRFDRT